MTSPILVTGGTGTLGRRLVPRLQNTGRDIRVLTRQGRADGDGVRFLIGDLATGEGIEPAVDGVATIVHCAGSSKGGEDKMREPRAGGVADRGPLPLPSQLGRIRVGGVDPNKPRMRAVLAPVLALTPAPRRVHRRRRHRQGQRHEPARRNACTVRQGAYDLRKLGGNNLIVKPGPSHRYQTPPQAARVIAALLTYASTSSPPASPGSAPPAGDANPGV